MWRSVDCLLVEMKDSEHRSIELPEPWSKLANEYAQVSLEFTLVSSFGSPNGCSVTPSPDDVSIGSLGEDGMSEDVV